MAYVIAEPCINTKDTACVDACPVDCIHPKKDSEKFAAEKMLYIDPVECIDCGACVPVCPVSAIFALDDLPEKWKEYTERERQVLRPLESSAVKREGTPRVCPFCHVVRAVVESGLTEDAGFFRSARRADRPW